MEILTNDLVSPPAHHARARGVDERDRAVEIEAGQSHVSGIEDELVLFDEAGQLVRLTLHRFAATEQLDEDVDLRAQDVGVERLEDVIDGTELVSAKDVGLAARLSRQKDDRSVARLLAFP